MMKYGTGAIENASLLLVLPRYLFTNKEVQVSSAWSASGTGLSLNGENHL
jgi:hypothetical protein